MDMRSVCPHIMVMGGPCGHEKRLPSYHGYGGVLVNMRSVCPHIMVTGGPCRHEKRLPSYHGYGGSL